MNLETQTVLSGLAWNSRHFAVHLLSCLFLLYGMEEPAFSAASDSRSTTAVAGHWAFQPLVRPTVPPVLNKSWPGTPVDCFVLARLEKSGLQPSPAAGRLAWLRRVCHDLTGLPPTPEQVVLFLGDSRPDAHARIVDQLLASPRYGERWAQHWLDVVRYADTHGFEVNTERPNAWPYRDYVIEAFNHDTPYDRFVQEQIAGDAFGLDAATGFLVTASVLLPGQIGADDVSKRLARQDALDEIVVNTGQAFLGLSVGCARCHDHKFDPIPSRDYYSMQAFFAGVEYGDRELRTTEAVATRKAVSELRGRLAEVEGRLARFEPAARPGLPRPRSINAKLTEEKFAAISARFVRFTIHDTSLHPTLGLIEPCVDEFQIFTDESVPRNVALASFGTKVTASGSRNSDQHKLEHINDGRYGNSRSWMSDEAGRGSVTFELPQALRINRIAWSRDRDGVLGDRVPIAYSIEAGPAINALVPVVEVALLRPPVHAERNSDRFPPVRTRRLKFTVLATNNLEPCMDEIEVYDSEGKNVALAAGGTRVSSTGDTTVEGRHELRFINDGAYGNSRSWMSSEMGRGSVTFEFPAETEVERVIWSRDRLKEYSDRLAIRYQIEVETSTGAWRIVADSSDRHEFAPGGAKPRPVALIFSGLNSREEEAARTLVAEKKSLQSRIEKTVVPVVFAGIFREMDRISLLNRGDPEQPKEEVTPAVLSALGHLNLAKETPEQERRLRLAQWIASPANPLTARVMVNRIWQGHFGTGLVDTPSDFGRNGSRPTHPELLDWLASEFIRSGWSIKAMHRLIVLSETYRQSSALSLAARSDTSDPEVTRALAVDAETRLLWRYPSRRLESEAIRDSMLAVNGGLNPAMGGRGFDLFNNRGGLSGFTPLETFGVIGHKRMIYAHKVRREREAVFGAFDCPDAGQSTARRRESTTPIQALNLFNSRFTLDQSEAFAARVQSDTGNDVSAQVRRAWMLAFGRDPDRDEQAMGETVVVQHGLTAICRALFNSNEFLFIP